MAKHKKKKPKKIYCPYCGAIAVKRKAEDIYEDVSEESAAKEFWVCSRYPTCDAYVTSGRDGKPLGMLANKELRRLRIAAHQCFDEIYKNKILTRHQAYGLLADRFGIPQRYAHIASFDTYRCNETIKMAQEILHTHPKTRDEYNKRKGDEMHGNDEETKRNVRQEPEPDSCRN